MYVLAEFPYPSGYGLHIGHAFTYTAADVYARFLRMQGKDILFPMGWDAFGLPTENYAIRTGPQTAGVTRENTENYQRQMQSLGFSFDWERMVDTTDPAYYKWTQWIFIQLFKHGLAFKREMPINWCPKDKIGLSE
jgi:leucyl-tRNA synthetase